MKPGRSLEILIENLEKTIVKNDNVTIESPRKLVDRTTGNLREHDVVITLKESHHQVLIGIECRDRSRPITVNQVEGFWAKCQHTGINQGIIVSPKGFYNSARKKAEHLGIRCLGLEQVTAFKWLLPRGITIINRLIKHVDWTVIPLVNMVEKVDDFSLIDGQGNIISKEVLNNNNIQPKMDEMEIDPAGLQPGSSIQYVTITFEGEGVYIRNNKNQEIIPIKRLIAKVQYELKVELSPFMLYKYTDKDQKEEIVDAAVSRIRINDKKGVSVLIAYKESEGGRVVVMHEGEDS